MSRKGIALAMQRGVAFTVVVLSLVGFAVSGVAGAAGLLLAVVVYAWFPTPEDRLDGWRYDRLPAVIMPDWLGFIAGGVLIALPVWGAGGAGLHVSAWLTWPMAAVFLVLPVIGWSYACFQVRIGETGLHVEDGWGQDEIPFAEIERIVPWRRGPARWLRWAAPVALFAGQPGSAGAMMLARDSTGFAILRRDGRRLPVPASAFDRGARAILTACARHGVPVAGGLSRYAPDLRRMQDDAHAKDAGETHA
ncbi:hypothetical protein [Roseovarius salinarum]|uniref:hypothetical protein n=1 Tax=Roseovarius salinarum TaxID=1981892 RepID=UPI000C331308|nr:hypothetical protein [Roseovarius salinarum]